MQRHNSFKRKHRIDITLIACVWIGTTSLVLAQSIQTLRAEAIKGDAKAESKVGVDYYFGRGLPQNYAKAAYWYRLAAHQGFAEAENNLGVAYDLGQGMPQNYAKAAYWCRLAAHQGVAGAPRPRMDNSSGPVGSAAIRVSSTPIMAMNLA